jgi:hypothetical protein
MSRRARRHEGKGSLEVLEEAFHLLRGAPPGAFACYYVGALPFMLSLLFFWGDMSRSPFAYRHLVEAACALGALFIWMKFWQSMFTRQLRRTVAGGFAPLEAKECGRIFLAQLTVQPTGLYLLPLAILPLALPFPWLYAFYQNVTALGGAEPVGFGALLKKAANQASLWRRQNLALVLILAGFGICVFVNWATVCFSVPFLAKNLFGVQSVFTRSATSLLNTTFFAAMAVLTHLCVDPLVKAVYTLRCFYGESLQSGEDLRGELRSFGPTVVVAVTILMAGICHAVAAEEADGGVLKTADPRNHVTAVAPAVSPPELDRAIQEVGQQRKYTWRAPREKVIDQEEDSQEGAVVRFLRRVGKFVGRYIERVLNWLGELLRKLFWRQRPFRTGTSGYSWIMVLQLLLYILIAAVVAGLGFLIYRLMRNRQGFPTLLASEPLQPSPDLLDENLGAEHLPEDGWTKLARELLARGELRLALRAFYLATLANLAQRNLITLAKFKSNRDYERELSRRGHSFPEMLELFGENVSVFERVWYGLHEINNELVSRFAANVDRIRVGRGAQ